MNKSFNAEKINIKNKEAKDLFSLAFNETAENTERLFETLLKDSLHVTLNLNKELASQLFLIESEIILDKAYPIFYLYAAATKPTLQGNGFMHELINYAKEITIKNKKHGIILKPANKGLFKFYASCGFNKILYSNIYEYSAKDCKTTFNEISANKYLEIREKLLKDTPHVVLKNILEDGINNHYHIFGNENSLTLAEKYTENGVAYIAEHLGDDSSLDYALKALNCSKAIVKTIGDNTEFSVIWLNNIKEPQYNIYHGPCFE